MINIIFQFFNEELGLFQNIGVPISSGTTDVKEASEIAKNQLPFLTQLQGSQVSYMLEQNGGILAKL